MINVNASTVADAEAVNGVVLDVNVMHGALSKYLGEFDEMIWPEYELVKRSLLC